jgi:lysophospholipase L1-like esterase
VPSEITVLTAIAGPTGTPAAAAVPPLAAATAASKTTATAQTLATAETTAAVAATAAATATATGSTIDSTAGAGGIGSVLVQSIASTAPTDDIVVANVSTGSGVKQQSIDVSGVKASAGTYVPTSPAGSIGASPLVLFNWDPTTQLAGYLAAQSAVQAGKSGTQPQIVAIGDSTTRGFGAAQTGWSALSYVSELEQALNQDGVAAQADNFFAAGVSISNGLVEDSRIALVGGATSPFVIDAGGLVIGTSAVGQGFDFTLNTPGTYDRVSLSYVDIGSGSVSVAVDGGGVLQTLQFGNTGQTLTETIDIPAGVHAQLNVRATNANPVYIEGASFWSSTAPAISVRNAGIDGWDSGSADSSTYENSTIKGSTNGFGPTAGVAAVDPTLVLIDLGINDMIHALDSTAQTVANIAQIVASVRSVGADAIIIIPQPFSDPSYASELPALRAGLQALSMAQNVPLIDLSATYGNSYAALSAAGLMSDTIHPDATLYADIGSQIAALLAKDTAPAVMPASTPVATNQSAATLGTVSSPDRLTVSLLSDSIFASGSSVALAGSMLRYKPGPVTTAGVDTISYDVTDAVTGVTTEETQAVTLTACFAGGTRIATTNGEVAVEALAIGDCVLTASGGKRPIRWIGHRHVEFARHSDTQTVCPVRIRTGAFAPGVPARDLVLSPEHAVYFETAHALTPIACLINGTTIAPDTAITEVTYYHVELDRHDVILAEGAAAESWLDTGNRRAFANAPADAPADPATHAATWAGEPVDHYTTRGYAPLLHGGPALDTIRAALARRAAALGRPTEQEAKLEVTCLGPVAVRFDADTRFVRLVSPAAFNGADRRKLGALIADMEIDGIAVVQHDRRLGRGFHGIEQHGPHRVRWTDGEAMIDFGPSAAVRKIAFTVCALARDDFASA